MSACWNYEQSVDVLLAAGERGRARKWCIIQAHAKTVFDWASNDAYNEARKFLKL